MSGSVVWRFVLISAAVVAAIVVASLGAADPAVPDRVAVGDPDVSQDSLRYAKPLGVIVDIRPGLCLNHLKVESAQTIPVAILGTMQFDVTNIDPGTVHLSREGAPGECAPARWDYSDTGSPVIGSAPDCNDPHGDGLDDLVMLFPIRDLVSTLGLAEHLGEAVPLVLRGKIVTGQGIEGTDHVIVTGGASGEADPRNQIGFVGEVLRGSEAGEVKFAYYTDTSDRIVFAVYDPSGKIVKTLASNDMAPGIYRVTWAGTAEDGQNVPDGIYFARVSNSSVGLTRKFILQR